MPKSDTWPGGVAMESLSNMDSAGSCDSVISMNSGFSEDSLEHLSAEERACLMYLEETIEALEVQEDSGLSNDEPDPGRQAAKMACHFPSVLNFFLVYNNAKSAPSNSSFYTSHSVEASEIDLGLIPPPTDFRDEPEPPPPEPEEEKELSLSAGTPTAKSLTSIKVEELRKRASTKKTPDSPSVTEEPQLNSPAEVPDSPSAHDCQSIPIPLPETAEPRGPPAVAPKPKKLPSNIILKSHRASVAGSDGNLAHSVSPTNDRLLLDPQRVRMEALRKLGLLKSDEADVGPALSPKHSPKSRRSSAVPSSPSSPAAPHTPTTPSAPSSPLVTSPGPASIPVSIPATVPPLLTSAAVVQRPDILPAPAAFSDPIKPLPSHIEVPSIMDVSEPTVNVKAQSNTPPLTPPAMAKQLTPPRGIGVKSATLERSGMGLSSYMASQEFNEAGQVARAEPSRSQLRNTRPRPASLGSRKEFSSVQGEGSQATSTDKDTRKSLPAPTVAQHSRDSQKLPRSHGISVLICPRAANGEDRREALKKLGLIRD
uniref:Specifically androgen-regulated gene protein n=1 Tax=Myripristis murdjan TaxID=586833 RepID=A0A667ZHX8_9TELE